MAKRKYSKHRKMKPHIPMAMLLPALADGVMIYNAAKDGLNSTEMNNLQYVFTGTGTGISGVNVGRLVETYGKYAAGAGISILATKTGINKKLYRFTSGYVGL